MEAQAKAAEERVEKEVAKRASEKADVEAKLKNFDFLESAMKKLFDFDDLV